MTTHDPDPADDPFVQRLRAQPPAALPASWRAEILAAARRAVPPEPPPMRWRRAAEALAAWLWPHPRAYAGMLAVWLLILALRWSTPSPASSSPPGRLAEFADPAGYSRVLARERLAINAALFVYEPREEGQP